jgi:prepilin-type N-terminal cleavage/methylation domain-containing protein/prepilin-type processing-associated H-X9-DG protein
MLCMERKGFTLIEFLVVIAVIALLAGILLPSLRVSRFQAESLICSSNLRQLASSLSMYHDENGTFPQAFDYSKYARHNPPDGGFAGDAGQNPSGWWWFNFIGIRSTRDYNQDTVIWCPSREITDRRLKRNELCATYGVNESICKITQGRNTESEFIGTPLSMNDIPRHSETMLVFDSGYSMINWWHVTNIPPEPPGDKVTDHAYIPGLKINKEKTIWPGLERDAINGRHPNKNVNAGFVDGHVERKKADDLYVEKTQESYKNRYPLWQPSKITITNY